MTPITKEWDRVVATLENNIAAFQKELDQPIIDATAKSVSAEIRSHFKGLKTGERVSAIQAAIEAGDESTVAAVCGAPSYLSGLDPELQASLKREWSERQNPKLAKRLRAVTAAHDHLLKRGSLLIGEWQKGVGVIEETREGPNGRRIVTKTIRASDIRAKKNRANEAFVLPTN
jgi:hypothetical protein